MYAGRVVEQGPVSRVFNAPAHPYTEALLTSIPRNERHEAAPDRDRRAAARPPPPCRPAARLRRAARARCRTASTKRRRVSLSRAATPRAAGSPAPASLPPTTPSRPGPPDDRDRGVGLSRAFRRGKRRSSSAPAARCARSTASCSTSRAGAHSGWSANSGCGKTTTAKLVLGLEEPTGGTMRFEGRDLQELDTAGRRHYRKSVQAVFQDPYASLNPRMRVSTIIAEPLVTNEKLPAVEVRHRVLRLLDLVGLPERAADLLRAPSRAARSAHRYRPLLGAVAEARRFRPAGLRPRRVDPGADPEPAARPPGRARALLSVHRPRPRRGRAYEPHDRGHVSGPDRRERRRRTLAQTPKHPYTEALFSAALPSHPDERREEIILTGEVPSRSTRRRAAAFTRAARMRWRCVR